ncbi:P-loop containing nucleoside triphosphate hydrolase protein [Athelia psychrophila]|uniref:P-loop containing nucleoside triphosphate hydrolase protein n=1 Tax=Athelia psychrophila TaxID=1759441 RepID=A0A166KT64_9AGAM|nr:P-loop containing nucleoside triphosphate hydrolase protein [Fibularhizoctonia sp. CBS 109695]
MLQVPVHPNIIVFGHTGAGKSSLVNMIAGEDVARTSNDIIGCTFKSEPYHITTPQNRKITLWDTAGLDEGPTGQVTTLAAMKNIRELTTQLADSTGLSLIIYMVRGRLVGSIRKNYLLFKAFCDGKVPFVIVVTGLDGESDRAGWWNRNEGHFREAGLLGDGHACIVSTKDRHNDKAYADSAREVFKLIEEKAYLRDPWMVDKKNWFIQTVINVMGVLLGSQSSKTLLEGLMANGVPEDEAHDAVKIFKGKYKTAEARSKSP